MDTTTEEQLLNLESSYKNKSKKELATEGLRLVTNMMLSSDGFKKPRLQRISKYYKLYDGKVDKKLRQIFNIPIPVFSGLIDTLNAQYDTPIELQFGHTDASDYFKAEKINAAWQTEKSSNAFNTMWDSKLRLARQDAIMTGRGVLKYTAESDPEYKSTLDVVNLKNFHFQPRGGLWLENHLFSGEEGIEKTRTDLIEGARAGYYDKEQVVLLINRSGNKDYLPEGDNDERLARFNPLGTDPENNSFVGQTVYRLVQFIFEMHGKRWYICFEPWTQTWLRCEPWSEMDKSDLYPWNTWATHEDSENFLSKSYADDLYPVADATISLFNQEITNREKRNNSPRGYDKDMVVDVRKLDEAAFRPDALIPFDTKGGTRRISEAVYEFKTGELGGTIDLVSWMKQSTGTDVGVTELSQGQVQQASKKASVTFAEQKSVSKRLSWGSQPYQQMLAGLGTRYVWGLKNHMPSKKAIKLLGEKGWDWGEITRLDLNTKEDIDVKIISLDKQIQESEMKKESRKEALIGIGADQLLAQSVNPKWRAEQILKSIGDYDDVDVAEALDTQGFGTKKILAHAAVAIQKIVDGKKPEMYHGADTAFMQKIIDVAREKQGKEPDMAIKLTDFAMAHQQIVVQNMQQKAIMAQQMQLQAQPQQPQEPGGVSLPPEQPMNQGVPPGVSQAMNIAQNAG